MTFDAGFADWADCMEQQEALQAQNTAQSNPVSVAAIAYDVPQVSSSAAATVNNVPQVPSSYAGVTASSHPDHSNNWANNDLRRPYRIVHAWLIATLMILSLLKIP